MALVSDIQLQNSAVKQWNIDASNEFSAEGLTATTAFAVTDGGQSTTVTPLGLITAQSENDISAYFNTTNTDGDVNLYLNNDENPYWNLKLSATAGTADSFMIANACGTDGTAEYPAFSISPAGAVGIGKTGANSVLDVAYANSTTGGLILTETTNTVVTKVISCASCSVMGTTSNHPLEIITNNTAVALVDAAGCVGIGTDDPCSLLHVEGCGCFTGGIETVGITGSGVLSIDDTTNSTSKTTGSIHTDGGLGVCCDAHIGCDINLGSTYSKICWPAQSLVAATGKLCYAGGDLTIVSGNGVVIGHTSQINIPSSSFKAEFQILGTGTADSGVGQARFSDGTAGPSYNFLKSRNGTIGSSTIVEGDDALGSIVWYGDDGNDYSTDAAMIRADVDGDDADVAENCVPGRIEFHTQAQGSTSITERMRIDNAGCVGIGTTDPRCWAPTLDPQLVVYGGANGGIAIANSSTTSSSYLMFGDGYGAASDTYRGYVSYVHSGDEFRFATGAVVRMTIDSAGCVGIGVSDPQHAIDVSGSAGLTTGTAWTNTSDSRIKTNVQTISGAVAKVKQLRPVSFQYNDQYLSVHDEIDGTKTYNSFIAEEYEEVFPDAVSIGGNLEIVTDEETDEKEILVEDLKQFTPTDLPIYLVAAVQELAARLEALES